MYRNLIVYAIALVANLSGLRAESSVSWVRDIPLPSMNGAALRYSDTAYDNPTVYLFGISELWRLDEHENAGSSWTLIDNAVLDVRMDSRTSITRDPTGNYASILNQQRTFYQYSFQLLARTSQRGPLPFCTSNSVTSDEAGRLIFSTNSQALLTFDPATGSVTNLLPSGPVGSAVIGALSTIAIGPDGYVRLLDYDNRRILKLGTDASNISANFISEFTLDLATTAINSIATSPWGSIYVGDGLGGGSIYNSDGLLLGTFGLPAGTLNDPNVYWDYNVSYNPYITVKSDGTIYVSDVTGFHQYYDASAVPEPATCALTLGGLMLMYVMRRRVTGCQVTPAAASSDNA